MICVMDKGRAGDVLFSLTLTKLLDILCSNILTVKLMKLQVIRTGKGVDRTLPEQPGSQGWDEEHEVQLEKSHYLRSPGVDCLTSSSVTWAMGWSSPSASLWRVQNGEECSIHQMGVQLFQRNSAGCTTGHRRTSWTATQRNATSCTWGGIILCTMTGWRFTGWKAAWWSWHPAGRAAFQQLGALKLFEV